MDQLVVNKGGDPKTSNTLPYGLWQSLLPFSIC